MHLRLSGDTMEALKGKKINIIAANDKYRRPGDAMTVDLARMDTASLVALHDAIEALPKQNGYTKHQAREVRMWLAIMDDPESQKVGKLHRLPSLLREFLKKRKVFRLYRKKHEQSDLWLPYAITDCTFTPGSRKTGPPYVTLRLAYYKFGEVKTKSVTFSGSVEKRTIEQLLLDRGYLVETKELYNNWVTDCERYVKLRGNYGHQVIGAGSGEVSSDDRWSRSSSFRPLVVDGVPSRLVVHKEHDEDKADETALVEAEYWQSQRTEEDEELRQIEFLKKVNAARMDEDLPSPHEDDEEEEEDDEDKQFLLESPLHAYTTFFDLNRHFELNIHVRAVEDYVYNKKLGEQLVLPKDTKDLIEMLLDETAGSFKDIIVGKSGGTIVLLSGPPGTGKTLTAEVYSETVERPLYKVQSAQLGTHSSTLEKELQVILQRAILWNALLLIDESDVFIHERGDDLEQNAVVGVFLRLLEYFNGVLFLATNRETLVDDAIASRCTAHVRYELPSVEEQVRIWTILAKSTGCPISEDTIISIVEKYPHLSGRDVKNLLKLGHLMVKRRGKKSLSLEIVDFIVRYLSSPNIRKEGELKDYVGENKPRGR